MTSDDVLKLTENEINQYLGKPTVSWGDKLPLMKPDESTILAVIQAWNEKQKAADASPIIDVCGIDYSSYSMDVADKKESCMPATWVAEAVKAEDACYVGGGAATTELPVVVANRERDYYKRDAEIMFKTASRYRKALTKIAELGTTQYPRALDMTKIAKDALAPAIHPQPSFSELPYSKAAPILYRIYEEVQKLDVKLIGCPSVEYMASMEGTMLRFTFFSNKYQARVFAMVSDNLSEDDIVKMAVEEVKFVLDNPPPTYFQRKSRDYEDGFKAGARLNEISAVVGNDGNMP